MSPKHRHDSACWHAYEPCGEHHTHDFTCGSGNLSPKCPRSPVAESYAREAVRALHTAYVAGSLTSTQAPRAILNRVLEDMTVALAQAWADGRNDQRLPPSALTGAFELAERTYTCAALGREFRIRVAPHNTDGSRLGGTLEQAMPPTGVWRDVKDPGGPWMFTINISEHSLDEAVRALFLRALKHFGSAR